MTACGSCHTPIADEGALRALGSIDAVVPEGQLQ